jgi:hypothetical protein
MHLVTSVSSQDKYLPTFDVREQHELIVSAPSQVAYEALRRVDFSRSRLIRTIFGIRTLPSFFRHLPWGTPRGAFVEHATGMGWVILEEARGRELVAGAVTQPWASNVKFTSIPASDFHEFSDPGFVKIVWGFSATPAQPGASVLSTETRAQATDPASRAKFLRYWKFVSPGIRVIRRVALNLARRDLAGTREAA